jgi:hypothetical protein
MERSNSSRTQSHQHGSSQERRITTPLSPFASAPTSSTQTSSDTTYADARLHSAPTFLFPPPLPLPLRPIRQSRRVKSLPPPWHPLPSHSIASKPAVPTRLCSWTASRTISTDRLSFTTKSFRCVLSPPSLSLSLFLFLFLFHVFLFFFSSSWSFSYFSLCQ